MTFWRPVVLSVAALSLHASAVFAEPPVSQARIIPALLVEDIGAAERVHAATRLAVLSQSSAAAACHLRQGVLPELSQKLLRAATRDFDRLLDALKHGNDEMNITGSELRLKTRMRIDATRALWTPVYEAAVRLLETPQDATAVDLILAESDAVLATAATLTSEIAGQYANPAEMLQIDALRLDFSGRQALRAQRLARLACNVWSGDRSEAGLSALASSRDIYGRTLSALRHGLPEAGILPARNAAIVSALDEAEAAWARIEADLDDLATADPASDALKQRLFERLYAASMDMDRIALMYVEHSKYR